MSAQDTIPYEYTSNSRIHYTLRGDIITFYWVNSFGQVRKSYRLVELDSPLRPST